MLRLVKLAPLLAAIGAIAALVLSGQEPRPPELPKAVRVNIERGQPPAMQPGEGVPVSFLVLDAAKGDPIPAVSIELRSPTKRLPGEPKATYWSYETQTDAAGKASLDDVAPSPYQVQVKREGRVLVSGSVQSVSFQPKDKPAPIIYRMFLASGVSGTVESRDRRPIPNVRVELLLEGWQAGMRVLELAQTPVETDAEGRYSFDAVLPGRYYLRARPNPTLVQAQLLESDGSDDPEQRHTAYVNTLYPATPYIESAAALNVYDGADQQGIRIEVQRDRYYPIGGRLENVLPEQKQVGLLLFRSVSFDSRFQFIWNQPYDNTIPVEVHPTDHTFRYEPGLPPGPYWAGFVPADKVRGGTDFRIDDRPLDDMRIDVTPAMTFNGKVVDEDGGEVPQIIANMMTFASRRALYQRSFAITKGGAFATSGLTPAWYRVHLQPGTPYVIRKIERDGRSYPGADFELTRTVSDTVITVSRKGAVIGGTVEMMPIAKEYPRGLVTAIADPAEPTDLPFRTRLDATNTFQFEHLEPGGYRLCAWLEEGTEVNQVMGNPSYEMKVAPRCVHVDVKADEAKSANLRQFSALEIR